MILMATHNGAAHLTDQLDSFLQQDHRNWSLVISDDGSTDQTRPLIAQFQARNPDRDIRLLQGPCQGSAANFLSLAARVAPPRQGYVALSDQDDIWMPHRLSRALEQIGHARQNPQDKAPPGRPIVYTSRTLLTHADMTPKYPSRKHPQPPRFGNALVQNILPGNTIVLDPIAADLLHRTAPSVLNGSGVPYHDWWIYLLMSGVGAQILCDETPGVFYRQHDSNELGANRGLRSGLSRIRLMRDGHYAAWIDRNLAALWELQSELTPANRRQLADFMAWRASRQRRFWGGGLGRLGIGRQTWAGDLMLRSLALMGRI